MSHQIPDGSPAEMALERLYRLAMKYYARFIPSSWRKEQEAKIEEDYETVRKGMK